MLAIAKNQYVTKNNFFKQSKKKRAFARFFASIAPARAKIDIAIKLNQSKKIILNGTEIRKSMHQIIIYASKKMQIRIK